MYIRNTFFLILVLLLTGCASLSQRQDDVKVTLVNLEMLDATLMEQRFVMSIRVQNRSPDPLSIRGMNIDVDINGKEFASGTSNQEATIDAFSDEVIEVKMSSTLFGIIRQIQAVEKNKGQSLSYVISGSIYSDGFFSIPFHEADEFLFQGKSGLNEKP